MPFSKRTKEYLTVALADNAAAAELVELIEFIEKSEESGGGAAATFVQEIDPGVTSADIGKLFYNDNGIAKVTSNLNSLPSAAAVAATSTLQIDAIFKPLAAPTQGYARIIFDAQPIDGDSLSIKNASPTPVSGHLDFFFRVSPIAQNDITIGASVAETIQNILLTLQTYINLGWLSHLDFSTTATEFIVTYKTADVGAKYTGNYSGGASLRINGNILPTGRMRFDDTIGNFTNPSPPEQFIDNGADGIPGTKASLNLLFNQQPTVGSRIAFGLNGANIEYAFDTVPGFDAFGIIKIVIGANISETIDNLIAPLAGLVTWSFTNNSPNLNVELRAQQTPRYSGNTTPPISQFFPQCRIISSIGPGITRNYALTSADFAVTGTNVNGIANNYVQGIGNRPANTVSFSDGVDSINQTLTADVEIPIGVSVTDQRDKVFDALVLAVDHPNLTLTKVSTNQIKADHAPPGLVDPWGFSVGGGDGGEASVPENSGGSDIFAGDPGYGPIGLGKLLEINGSNGTFSPVIGSSFAASGAIPKDSLLAAGPDGTVRVGDGVIDWIVGRAAEDYVDQDQVLVNYAPRDATSFDAPIPKTQEEALNRIIWLLRYALYGPIPNQNS